MADENLKFNNVLFTSVDELLAAVSKAKELGKAKWWACFEIVLCHVGDQQLVKAICVYCKAKFAVSNLARLASSHLKDECATCVGLHGQR
jgi:hypothetical protein